MGSGSDETLCCDLVATVYSVLNAKARAATAIEPNFWYMISNLSNPSNPSNPLAPARDQRIEEQISRKANHDRRQQNRAPAPAARQPKQDERERSEDREVHGANAATGGPLWATPQEPRDPFDSPPTMCLRM